MPALHAAHQHGLSQGPKPRSNEILDSIRTVFVEKGFDGASMQDLARGAGMSVGNFYRYFPSKAAMVEALITRDLEVVEAQFHHILAAPDPTSALRAALHERILSDCGVCAADAPLWAEMTAAALRKPEIAQIIGRMETQIIDLLIRIFAQTQGLAPQDARERFAPHVGMLILLVKGSGARVSHADIPDARLTGLVVRMLDQLLDEIFTSGSKG